MCEFGDCIVSSPLVLTQIADEDMYLCEKHMDVADTMFCSFNNA